MTGRAVLPVSCLKYANVVSRALTRRSGRSGWSSSPCMAAWWRISAWTSLCPATQPAIELRKVSSAVVQQFSSFVSPSSPALHGVVVQRTLLYCAMQGGREMNVSMENLASYVALVCHWLLVEANQIRATGAAAHCAVLSNCMRCAVWRARASPGCSTSCRSTTSKGISGTAVCHCTHSTTTVFPAVCY